MPPHRFNGRGRGRHRKDGDDVASVLVDRHRLTDAEWLREQYIDQGLSMARLAESCGCSISVIRRALAIHDIPRRSASEARAAALRERPAHVRQRTADALRRSNITHGRSLSPIYAIWKSIIARCENPSVRDYSAVGGRGIRVCDEWRQSFDRFLADMGERPPGKCLTRINHDEDYSRRNCRWAPHDAAVRNRIRAGERVIGAASRLRAFTAYDIARETGLSRTTVSRHLCVLAEKGAVRATGRGSAGVGAGRGGRPIRWEYILTVTTESAAPRAKKTRDFSGGGRSGTSDLPADKDMRVLARQAIAAGAKVKRSGEDHFIVTTPSGRPVTISNTPSSNRAVANARADLKREGLAV